jgi:hypothetical protein
MTRAARLHLYNRQQLTFLSPGIFLQRICYVWETFQSFLQTSSRKYVELNVGCSSYACVAWLVSNQGSFAKSRSWRECRDGWPVEECQYIYLACLQNEHFVANVAALYHEATCSNLSRMQLKAELTQKLASRLYNCLK